MSIHKSVLLHESIDALDLKEGDVYLDATTGSGGHMLEVWKRFGDKVTLLGIDADTTSLIIAEEKMTLENAEPKLLELNFRNIDKVPDLLGFTPNKILFDLGWSSDQFEEGGRGFSFNEDEPLLMTFKSNSGEEDITAHEIVNNWREENIADVIYGYGEENFSRRIAKKIVEEREKKEIKTSRELAEIIKSAVPVFYRFGRIHPATKTFQAIRIAVNDELRALEDGLKKAINMIKKNGRVVVITFHSLEDRIVKNIFKEAAENEVVETIYKKPITASDHELEKNRRSRSAKLRAIIKKQ
jgi:16S rRNA (cytosine1402-N4)-methyltransferase